MTDLVERYLSAVARELPERQRKDIIAELREDLLSRIERQEEAQGARLIRDDLERVLLDYGNPLVVAGRYRSTQHLIGPEMFPLWWVGIKWSLSVVAGIYTVLFMRVVANGTAAGSSGERDELPGLVTTLLMAFGAVTAAAAIGERMGWSRRLYRWKPRELPPVGQKSPTPFERVVEISMMAIFVSWWTGWISLGGVLSSGPFGGVLSVGALQITLAPMFERWFWPVLTYALVEISVNALGLARPGLTRLNMALTLTRWVALAALMLAMFRDGPWLVVNSTVVAPAELAYANDRFNEGMRLGFLITLGVALIMSAINAHRLRQIMRSGGDL
jgi:hypothetical protein